MEVATLVCQDTECSDMCEKGDKSDHRDPGCGSGGQRSNRLWCLHGRATGRKGWRRMEARTAMGAPGGRPETPAANCEGFQAQQRGAGQDGGG